MVLVDVCGTEMGVVVMQEGHPLVYINQPLSNKHQGLSTYEKELIAVSVAVDKWRL